MVQYLVQPNKDSDCLRLISRVNETKDLDLETKATQAAIDFYREQARVEQIFHAREKENKEFWEAGKTCRSYPDKYTGDLDLPTSIWKDKCKDRENPFLENDYIHGEDCQRKNKCSCTSDWEVEQNEKKRDEKHRLDHYHKRKPKSAKKQKKQKRQKSGKVEDLDQ